MYSGLVHAHSGLRWLVLLFLIIALVKGVSGWMNNKAYTEGDRKMALFALIFTHVQLLLGLWLYFISPKVSFEEGFMKMPMLRFFSVEHMSMMLIAIILITIGYSTAKRAATGLAKHKKIAIFYGLGLLIMLLSIPWPFRGLGAGWF